MEHLRCASSPGTIEGPGGRTCRLVQLLGIWLVTLTLSSGAQTIANGDMNGVADFQQFNSVVPQGWTGTNGSVDLFDATTAHYLFAWQASLGGGPFVHGIGFVTNPEGLNQVVTGLSIGSDYEIEFEQTISNSFSTNTPHGFWRVTFGAQVQDSTPVAVPPLGISEPWQPESLTFTATATSQVLAFNAYPLDFSSFPSKVVDMGLDSVVIDEVCNPASPGIEFVRLGVPPNPFALLPGITGPPLIGSVWNPVIDHTSFVPSSVLDFYAFSLMPANIPAQPLGTILCTPPFFTLSQVPGTPLGLAIPGSCNLVMARLCLSGASLDAGGGLFLTNALDVEIGGS